MNYCKQCGNEWDGSQTVCPKCGWDPATEDEDMDEDLLGGALDDMDDEWGEKTVALTPKQMEAALAASAGKVSSGNAGSDGQGAGRMSSGGTDSGAPASSGSAGSGGQDAGRVSSVGNQVFDNRTGASGKNPNEGTVAMNSAQVMSAMDTGRTDSSMPEESFLQSKNGRIVVASCIVVVVLIIIAFL